MAVTMVRSIIPLALLSLYIYEHGDAGIIIQRVSQGIESVNGSDVNMGCTSPLVDSGDGVTVCSSGCSTLLDGISPTIDTSTSDWASQLVTVRKTDRTTNIPYPHVLLTFGFGTVVSLTGIELDLFLCPDWNIGAPVIYVYANNDSNIAFIFLPGLPQQSIQTSISACDSLSTVSFNLANSPFGSPFLTWHIVVSAFHDSIEWVHVGEVRFLGADGTPIPICTTTVETSVMSSTQTPRSGIVSTVFSSSDGMSTLDMTTTTSNLPSHHLPSSYRNSISVSPPTSVSGGKKNDYTSTFTSTESHSSSVIAVSAASQLPTSVPKGRDAYCEDCSNTALIAVSAVSFLLIVTLITVILIQCLLILRMRRSVKETPAEYMTPTTMNMDVPVSTNEVYALHKITKEVTYELVK